MNTTINNIKNAIFGTYYCIDHIHLPRYLGEIFFFIRRLKFSLLLRGLMYNASYIRPVSECEL